MKSTPTLVSLAALTMILWTTVPSRVVADVVLDLSIEELSRMATVVLHGRVLTVESDWDDSHTRIFTRIELEVISYLAGSGPDTVVIRQLGGRVGETVQVVTGQPQFAVGDQVLVFLEPDGSGQPNRWVTLTMAAGAFRVSFDRLTGEAVLSRDLGHVCRVRPREQRMRNKRSRRRTAAPQRVARPMLLREVTQQIRAARRGGAR